MLSALTLYPAVVNFALIQVKVRRERGRGGREGGVKGWGRGREGGKEEGGRGEGGNQTQPQPFIVINPLY